MKSRKGGGAMLHVHLREPASSKCGIYNTHGDVLKLVFVCHRKLLVGGEVVRRLFLSRRDLLRIHDLKRKSKNMEQPQSAALVIVSGSVG